MGLIEAKALQAGTRTYMEFSSEMLEQVVIITQGKSLGFTLNEIKHSIDTWGNGSVPSAEKLKVIARKLEEIGEKMRQLEEIKLYLTAKVAFWLGQKPPRVCQNPQNLEKTIL